MKIRKIFSAISASVVFAAAMPALPAVNAIEIPEVTYISDIKVVGIDKGECEKGNSPKTWLTDEGYTVIDFDLNEGCNGDYIYLGYKTTHDFKEAIKDIIVIDKSAPADDYIVEQDGVEYVLCPYDGTDHFTALHGDLNSHAGGNDGHFFYTKDNSLTEAVTAITFDSDITDSVGDYNLNGDRGIDIFMHLQKSEDIMSENATGEFNDHFYAVIKKEMTPPDAKAYCESLGGYLATITSQEEQDFVASLASNVDYHDFWIGGSDDGSEGEWYWMNGEPWEYTAWYPGGSVGTVEPNNGLGLGDDYAAISRARDYQWVDAFGGYDGYTTALYFICEWGEASAKNVRSAFEPITGLDFDDKEGELRVDAYGVLGWTREGAYAVYKNIDFGNGADTFTFNGISNNTDNYIELHIDAPDGELIGTCQIDKTGSWGKYIDYSCAVAPVTGIHDLYLVFRHTVDESSSCSEVNWFVFSNGGSISWNGHKYQRFDNGMTWDEAEAYCESLGGHLAVITSEEEQQVVASLAYTGSKNNYWIGGRWNSDGEFAWVTDEPFEYTAWSGGEPNNGEGIEDAIMMWSSDGAWNDLPSDCQAAFEEDKPDYGTENFGFICEWEDTETDGRVTFNGHQYKVFDESMKWNEAKEYCENLGGHLVTITSQEEEDFIEELIDRYTKITYHIGLTDDGKNNYSWVTDEVFDYSNNISGADAQSSQYTYVIVSKNGAENTIHMWADHDDGIRGDMWDYTKSGFICEWDEVETDGRVTFNGHQYKVIDKSMTWTEAEEYCESLGGHLVTITSKEEDEFILNTIADNETSLYFWIGGSDSREEGKWEWVTGEEWDYNHWKSGQPNDYKGWCKEGQDYAVIVDKDGRWEDCPDDGYDSDGPKNAYFDPADYGFICEWDYVTTSGKNAYDRIQGEAYDDGYGIQIAGISNGDATSSDGGVIGWISKGSYAIYKDVNFSGGSAKQMIICASNPTTDTIRNVSVYIDGDNETGSLIATVPIQPTKIWNNYVINTQAVGNITGVHDVFLLFDGGVNLDYFYFSKEKAAIATLVGDANCDGKTSVADAVAILQSIGNRDKYALSEQGMINADVDGNAGVTGMDALVLQQVDSGMIKLEELPLNSIG